MTLLRGHGWLCVDPPALAEDVLSDLFEESSHHRADAWPCVHDGGRNGASPQRNHRAELGPVARRVLLTPAIQRPLLELAGGPVALAPEASCYTYYAGPGDFLAPHRDRPEACALTALVYLAAATPDPARPGPGMYLHVHGPAGDLELAARAVPGRAVFLRGAELLHGRPALAPGESVTVLSACFRRSA